MIVYLSQRFQVLTHVFPLHAGIRLIPFSAVATLCTTVSNLATLKGRLPFIYFVFGGSVLLTVGMALLSTLPEDGSFPKAGYGYEVLSGAGIGATIGSLILAVPYVVETRDLGK